MTHQNEKQSVALSSMLASAIMTIAKFIVGFATGSLGLISEGLHSLLDFGATVLTYLAVSVSDKPADSGHHYGHGKIESVAALAETALLFITSIWIVYEAFHRLVTGCADVEVTWWSVAVISISILVDISRARALKLVAEKTGSQAIEADALHFSSDVLSSGVVLLGLGLVAIGYPKGDPIAAVGVAVFVCLAGWRLGKRTIDTLIDAAPHGSLEMVREIVERIPGVAAVNKVRVRPAGSVLFVETEISVGRGLPQNRVDEIRFAVAEAIKARMPEAETIVIARALALDDETVHDRVVIIARNHGAAVHHVTVYHAHGKIHVGLDLEVDGRLSLRIAHDMASRLENEIRAEFGGDIEIETHIEPLQTRVLMGGDVAERELEKIGEIIRKLASKTEFLHNVHKIRARQTDEGLIVAFHCRTDAGRSVMEAHNAVDELERQIRREYPDICRIIGHVEPARDS